MEPSPFLDHLKQSRLLSADQFQQVTRLAEMVSAEELPDALVSDGILTSFQAQRVAGGDFRSLVLGPYHILEEVGRGGMGRVYKALHTVMGRVVALKLMAPEVSEDERSRERFLREVRSVTRLSHPNIVLAYDANEAEGLLFLAMEYVEGTTLAELVRAGGALPVPRACEIMRQAALGLQHAFQKGLVHRDIKPANLLVPRAAPADIPTYIGIPTEPEVPSNTLVKIADFGLARLHGLQGGGTMVAHTSVGFLGTPDYVAPEQCRDASTADIRSDLYSLGCTFHFLLAGTTPFGGDSAMEKMFAHVTTPPPRLDGLRREVPRGVADIVARLMEKDPARRFQTPAELVQALAPWCAKSENLVVLPAQERQPSPPPTRKEPSGKIDILPIMQPSAAGSLMGGDSARTPTPTPKPMPTPMPTPTPMPSPSWGWDSDPNLPDYSGPVVASSGATALLAPVETQRARVEPEVRQPVAATPTPATHAHRVGSISPAFRQAWAEWTAVVAALARRPGILPCGEQAYQELHRALLADCAEHARRAGEEMKGPFRQLEALVRPWMSLGVLARTEPMLLADLARRASAGGQLLGLREPSRGWILVLGFLLLVAVALPFAGRLLEPLAAGKASAWRTAQPLLRSVSSTVGGGPTFWITVVGLAGVLLAFWRLGRRRN